MDQVVLLELHVLNFLINNSVLNPIIEYSFALMDHDMIMTDARMLSKNTSRILSILIIMHSQLRFMYSNYQLTSSAVGTMEVVDGYQLENVKSSDNAQTLLLLQMMNISYMDQYVLLIELLVLPNQLVLPTRHKQLVIDLKLM
ncbi:unnamed protein product (macronuclear) [Paramecium tetraurelia]|uniref:Uncharacterized protein n=1 Tax=Paramecium tetraurelia TaxID=5888 RepID=A0CRX1_PARTE|nr:uncharacterized protein GSPATT00038888001 [Paramecium tetraurelia]CAK73538.1 unnamed protein product [Paramecium tetraurelia]|eukprot:XP_001440935.1 hypothetical protein (macronuclear) [Paramecium tetraurelia strain d4-2]